MALVLPQQRVGSVQILLMGVRALAAPLARVQVLQQQPTQVQAAVAAVSTQP
jgi:hypothetical protein